MQHASCRSSRWSRRSRLVSAIAAVTGLLLVSACAGGAGGSGGSAGGAGVPANATKEQFVAALADMEEITLTTQSASTPGKSTSIPAEKYKEVVEEWSGGKIKIEITYGNGLVPLEEALTAVGDGLMDFGYVSPLYEPDRYPASSALITTSAVAQPTPVVGSLQTPAVLAETTYSTPDVVNELEDAGAKLLIPAFPSDSAALSCTSKRASLDQLSGSQVRVPGDVHSQQAEALRMSPVSLAYSEIFEALQRGTVDCIVSLLLAADLLGFLAEAPHIAFDPAVGFATSTNPIVFSKDRWDELPLAAQQLLYDKGKEFLEEYLHVHWAGDQSALKSAAKAGGGVHGFDTDAREALQAKNDELLEQVTNSKDLSDGDTFAQTAKDSADKWTKILTEELGYEDVSCADFADWYERDKVDVKPYLDRLWEEVMAEHRPS